MSSVLTLGRNKTYLSALKKFLFTGVILSLLAFAFIGDNDGPRFDEKDTSAIIKSSYIYNFAKLIDWPDDKKRGNFIIGVMGGSSMYQQLVTKYNGKTIGSQPIEIRKISSTQNFSVCHVLFVDHDHNSVLDEVVPKINNESTLLITHKKGGLSIGAAINFVVVEDNLKFELSVSNAEKQGLFVGSTLKSLALHVEN